VRRDYSYIGGCALPQPSRGCIGT